MIPTCGLAMLAAPAKRPSTSNIAVHSSGKRCFMLPVDPSGSFRDLLPPYPPSSLSPTPPPHTLPLHSLLASSPLSRATNRARNKRSTLVPPARGTSDPSAPCFLMTLDNRNSSHAELSTGRTCESSPPPQDKEKKPSPLSRPKQSTCRLHYTQRSKSVPGELSVDLFWQIAGHEDSHLLLAALSQARLPGNASLEICSCVFLHSYTKSIRTACALLGLCMIVMRTSELCEALILEMCFTLKIVGWDESGYEVMCLTRISSFL